jgi:hypothetical protein
MPGFLELMDILEELDKAFVHDLLHLFEIVLVAVAYFNSIVPEHGI